MAKTVRARSPRDPQPTPPRPPGRPRPNRVLRTVSVSALALAGGLLAQPALALQPGETAHIVAVGPVSSQTTFPQWYQDHTGLTLMLGTNNNCLPGLCNNDPPDPTDPFQVQTGFGEEAFWWSADASLTINPSAECPTCSRGILVMALEAAYNIAPAPDDQFTFGRIRVRIDAPVAGRYKLTFPFGERLYDVTEPGIKAINVSEDVGTQGRDFAGPLKSGIGAFLTWDPNVAPAAPAGTIGDPAVEHTVVGATFKDAAGQPFNKVRFEYLDGPIDLDGQGHNFIEVNTFAISGLLFDGITQTPLSVPRATVTDGRVEVVADSSPNATVTVAFDDESMSNTLVGNGSGSFYTSKAKSAIPHVAHVTAKDPDNGSTTVNAVVKDVVTISAAQYDPAMQTLLVRAKSSVAMATPTPTLTAVDFGEIDPATGSLTVHGVTVAPAWVQVNSSYGGSARLATLILNESMDGSTGEPPPPPPPPPSTNLAPVAQNDTASTVLGTSIVINVAGSDVDADGTLNLASIQIVQPPRCGTIGIIAAAGIEYLPGPDFGTLCDVLSPDTFTYTISDNLGAVSNTASVTVSPISAQVTVTQAQFVSSKREWRVRGTTNAVNGAVQASLVSSAGTTLIGSAVADATGAFDLRTTGGPVAARGDTLTIKIGTTNVSGIPVTIKN